MNQKVDWSFTRAVSQCKMNKSPKRKLRNQQPLSSSRVLPFSHSSSTLGNVQVILQAYLAMAPLSASTFKSSYPLIRFSSICDASLD